ncbi:MAG: hypothetical protein UX91_C0005G0054 [Candidatus Amesbacteria bacterium GW2011_GWB1_47_19]|nr:MAG: hypothetical protein UW51_C0007G0054 [Candidatus Amesbacteria bacterium GW2011_GWA1_44_24]KKU31136.1 MAG: hypothetical protein UX46_C0007G0054 [Candidatus Amesbacteria bacterium GW2011_GWC1_46_24]KKU67257.1 MAG: hypothetical protein UX91_C0005G0054 [Candidatus Amesbacteria bacterium GW2011_GWB1_47_19]
MLEGMQSSVVKLLESLNKDNPVRTDQREDDEGPVEKIAQAYELARNAMEYRAEHLVRRAAIERILKRQLLFGKDASSLAGLLLRELKWAKYIGLEGERAAKKEEVRKILETYTPWLDGRQWEREWLVGLISAAIEERLSQNRDYHAFTGFVFGHLKSVIVPESVAEFDLILYVAVDKVFSQSDNQQISYHLYNLVAEQAGREGVCDTGKLLEITRKQFLTGVNHPLFNRLSVVVRKITGPLVLVRDIYFSDPTGFEYVLADADIFKDKAMRVLSEQLRLLRGRMSTAGWRSLIYVFLTKMLFALILEIPIDRWLRGNVAWMTLTVNTVFPVGLMWVLTANIRLPGGRDQEKLVKKAWLAVSGEPGKWLEGEEVIFRKETKGVRFNTFLVVYAIFSAVVFGLILGVLFKAGFSVISGLIFIFFVTVVSFFAYRIRQTAQIYSQRTGRGLGSSVGDMLMLPIVAVGSWLSLGVSKLNFLVFVFDFILEAPFKMILRVLDNWFDFLSGKRDEVVG